MPKIRKPRVKKVIKPFTGKIKTIEIEESLARFFDVRKCIMVPNISWGFHFGHEMDLFVLKSSGYAVEVEIKISVSDFRADFKKGHHHESRFIREFFYAMPIEIYNMVKDEIPVHAGVITCERNKTTGVVFSHLKKSAKANTKSIKLSTEDKLKIGRLAAMRIFSLKKKIIELTIERLK